jgi:hypothetical protein
MWIHDIAVRSGSANPYHWLTDSDPYSRIRTTDSGSCFSRQWLIRRQPKKWVYFFKAFLIITFWWYIYISFSWIKSQKAEIYFFYFFCLLMERSGSGSEQNNDGSGSGRPKNIRMLRIRTRYFSPKMWLSSNHKRKELC